MLAGVRRVVESEGHRLSPGETRVQPSHRRQVAGVVVNASPGAGRREVDALRALLHDCVVHGPASQDRQELGPLLREHLTGLVAWVEHLRPEQGRRLRAELERIRW